MVRFMHTSALVGGDTNQRLMFAEGDLGGTCCFSLFLMNNANGSLSEAFLRNKVPAGR